MQVLQILHQSFAYTLSGIHRRRLDAFMAAVTALLYNGALSLTALGRSLRTAAYPKHAIKRIDRLLRNPHLHAERTMFYRLWLHLLVGNRPTPVLLVDWSHLDASGTHFLLRVALPIGGRALPVYEKVHSKEGCPKAQQRCLDVLEALLPVGCRPILITDAGFRRPWFQAVQAKGWFYVGRLRNREHLQLPSGDWSTAAKLYNQARTTPQALGEVTLTQRHAFATQLYLFKGKAKGRKQFTAQKQVARSKKSRACAQREREPWVLLSNLPKSAGIAKRVVKLYRLRMQIEEGFRDLKNRRFGFDLRQQGCRSGERIEILLLIAAVATYAVLVCGLIEHRRGTAHSLFYLGWQAWLREQRTPLRQLGKRELRDAEQELIERAAAQASSEDGL
jgi:hypothetical protein